MQVRSYVIGGGVQLFISLLFVSASDEASHSATTQDAMIQSTVEEQRSDESSVSARIQAEPLPAGTVFVVVAARADEEGRALELNGLLSYHNPRLANTILEHYNSVSANRQRPGRQACPLEDSIWTVRPKDALLVTTGTQGEILCVEGGAYAIGRVARVTSGARTTKVIVEEGAMVEQKLSHRTRSIQRSPLVVSHNLLGRRKNDRRALRRTPQIESGDLVVLVCGDAHTPVVVLQTDNAAPLTGKKSMTSSVTAQIPNKAERGLNGALNFLTYCTVFFSSLILAGHGLLAVDGAAKARVSNKMVGERYTGGDYNFLRVFISPKDIRDYYRAQSTANLRIAAGEVISGRDIRAGIGYTFAGFGIRAVNSIFPVFLTFLLAYLVHRPVLWPVQKLYESFKRRKAASKYAAATRSSVEISSLCPPKRILVKCVDLHEQLEMMG